MLTVSDVAEFLDKFAPPELAEDWDNAGLLVGRRAATVQRVMTCLTLTADVAAEAIEDHVQLIVSHHPVLFRAASRLTADNAEGEILLKLIEAGIAVYSPHTRFDSAAEGINQKLAESLCLRNIRPVRAAEPANELGSGRWGRLEEPMSLEDFLKRVKHTCAAGYVEFTGQLHSPVSTVAVACGSAAEFLNDAIKLGCDTFVTGEARFHAALQARSDRVNLVLVGHYSSERPALERLADVIGQQFLNVEAFASRKESDPLHIY